MSFLKNIKILRWHSFFSEFSLWAPLAIIYFSKISGSYTLGISIFSIIMLSAAIFEIPTGFISDKYGRTKTLIFGAIAFAIASILYAIGLNYWILVIGAVVQGLGRSFYSGNNDALLYDNLQEMKNTDDFAEHNGKINSMAQIALGVSAMIGGFIAYFSFPLLMWISVIPQLICLVLALKLTEIKEISHQSTNIFNHTKEAFKNLISNVKLRYISLSDMISFGLGEAGWNFRSAFIATIWPVWAIGIAQVLCNFGSSLSFHFSGKALKKIKPINVLIFKINLNVAVNLIALVLSNIFSPILMSINSLFYGIGQVSKDKLLQDEFTSKQRATMGSLNSLGGSLCYAIFAILLGVLADKFGPRNALIVQSILVLSVLYFYFSFKKIVKNERK
ncbi:MAG: MFS transporter [Candidatus Shapirobacteria bacterium]